MIIQGVLLQYVSVCDRLFWVCSHVMQEQEYDQMTNVIVNNGWNESGTRGNRTPYEGMGNDQVSSEQTENNRSVRFTYSL